MVERILDLELRLSHRDILLGEAATCIAKRARRVAEFRPFPMSHPTRLGQKHRLTRGQLLETVFDHGEDLQVLMTT
jgi:hypothetical protein